MTPVRPHKECWSVCARSGPQCLRRGAVCEWVCVWVCVWVSVRACARVCICLSQCMCVWVSMSKRKCVTVSEWVWVSERSGPRRLSVTDCGVVCLGVWQRQLVVCSSKHGRMNTKVWGAATVTWKACVIHARVITVDEIPKNLVGVLYDCREEFVCVRFYVKRTFRKPAWLNPTSGTSCPSKVQTHTIRWSRLCRYVSANLTACRFCFGWGVSVHAWGNSVNRSSERWYFGCRPGHIARFV